MARPSRDDLLRHRDLGAQLYFSDDAPVSVLDEIGNYLRVAGWGTFHHTILPALALAAMPTAFIARLTRASMIEVLEQDYIQTAKAKGVSTLQLICRHALKNSLLPVMSYIGYLSATILTGSFVVEKIFAIPGLGQWFVQATYVAITPSSCRHPLS